MANITLLKAAYTGGIPTGLAEMQAGDTIPKARLEPLVVGDVSGAQPSAILAGVNAIQSATMGAALRGLDALVMPIVHAYLANTPPGSPADGYTAIIGAAPTSLWAGKGGQVTRWSASLSAYEFYAPKNGWMLQSNSARETYRYTGSAWEIYYQQGTWTVSPTSLTVVGTPTYTGRYTRVGDRYDFIATATATTSTASTRGVTTFNLPFTAAAYSACSVVNSNGAVDIGTGFIVGALAYPPTWGADAGPFVLVGTVFI